MYLWVLGYVDTSLYYTPKDTAQCGIYVSSNDGTDWTKVGGAQLIDSTYASALVTSGNNLFVGTGYGIYLSTNRGTTWTSVDAGFPDGRAQVNSLAIDSSYLVAALESSGANYGTGGIWRRPLSEMITAVKNRGSILRQTFDLRQNYPNPFNPSTVITYQLPSSASVSLRVFDVLGRKVETLVSGRQSAGIHSVAFTASSLPSGVYFYRLQAGEYHDTKKCLLLK